MLVEVEPLYLFNGHMVSEIFLQIQINITWKMVETMRMKKCVKSRWKCSAFDFGSRSVKFLFRYECQ